MNKAVRAHFGKAARDYGRLRGSSLLGRIRAAEQRSVRDLAPVAERELVLDAGSGDGTGLLWLQARGARVVAMDLTPAMAAQAARQGHPAVVQDMQHTGFGAVFDWVLCIGSLEFTTDPSRALSELAACLKPGGTLVLLYPHPGIPGLLYRLYHRSHGVSIRWFSRARITDMVRRAGLRTPHAWRRNALSSTLAARCPKSSSP